MITGAVENGAPGTTGKPLLSIGLGPFSLQLGLQQQWLHQPMGQMQQTGTTNVTLPSLTILVPNAVLNVSGLQPPAGQIVFVPVPAPADKPAPAPAPAPMPLPLPWETTTSVVIPQSPPKGPGQPPGEGYVVTETVDSMGNVMQTIQPISSTTVDGQVITYIPGTPGEIIEEIVEVPAQANQPGTPGIIRKGVINRLTGGVLQRNNTKPVINFIKGH